MNQKNLVQTLSKMTLIAGPCVIEDEGLALEVAQELKTQLTGVDVDFYYKSSFDKANRTSVNGFRGPGLEKGLKILDQVKVKTGLKLLTDLHETAQIDAVTDVVDFVQIPAFLCRQTDLVWMTAKACLLKQKKLNIKKGQFLAPWDAANIVQKVRSAEAEHLSLSPPKDWFCLTERGTSFGYNTLVVDMISFKNIKAFGVPVIYDATHSIQTPGGGPGGKSTGGKRQYLEVLARAAMSAGADGLFMECHPRPNQAKSDGPNAFYLEYVGAFVKQMIELRNWAQTHAEILPESLQM